MSFCPITKVEIFMANWCGPCTRMKPQMRRLKNQCKHNNIPYIENIAPDDDEGKNDFRVNQLQKNGLTKIPSVIIHTYVGNIRRFDNLSTDTWNDVYAFMDKMIGDGNADDF
jgi:thiol-disulfide isomerase/thioredoxin